MEENNTDKNKTKSVSLFAQSEELLDSDPIEEIFALNLGDFLTEHLISDDLANKINKIDNDKTEGLKNQLRELISIYSTDKTLSILGFNSKEDYILYSSIAKTIKEMAGVDACHIYLTEENTGAVTPLKHDLVLVGTSLNIENDLYEIDLGYNLEDNALVTTAFNTKQTMLAFDFQNKTDLKHIQELDEDKVQYSVVVPMLNSFECVGVTVVQNYVENKILTTEFIQMIEVTAKLFATSIALQKASDRANSLINDPEATMGELQNIRAELTALIGDLSSEQQAFVENLAKAVDSKSQFRANYSRMVAELAGEICTKLQLNEKTKDLVYYAALLRNIGKISIPIELFNKKGHLTKEDWAILYNHPNIGVNLLMSINFMAEVIPYIHYHKEYWDGSGKSGLKGNSIPLGSRIIAVADAYSALTSDRAYRKAFTKEEALEIMKKEANTKWDPMLVNVITELKS